MPPESTSPICVPEVPHHQGTSRRRKAPRAQARALCTGGLSHSWTDHRRATLNTQGGGCLVYVTKGSYSGLHALTCCNIGLEAVVHNDAAQTEPGRTLRVGGTSQPSNQPSTITINHNNSRAREELTLIRVRQVRRGKPPPSYPGRRPPG